MRINSPTEMRNKLVNVCLTEVERDRLKEVAYIKGESMSSIASMLIREFLKEFIFKIKVAEIDKKELK